MTNFDYLTKDKATLAHMIDKHMTKPSKCQFCVDGDRPSCPVNARCLQNIMRWLVQERAPKQE